MKKVIGIFYRYLSTCAVKLHTIIDSRIFWPSIALLLLAVINSILIPDYLSIELVDGRLSGYLIDVLRDGSAVMLVAIGMTLVIATGGVDLSVGAIMAISAVVSASMATSNWVGENLGPNALWLMINYENIWLSLVFIASILAAVLAGSFNGVLVSIFRIQPIIATLILMVAGRGVAQLISNGKIYTYNHQGLEYIGKGTFLAVPFSLWIVVVAAITVFLLTRRSSIGLMVEAIGDNDKASYYAGIRSKLLKFLVYIICALCAGIAGLIESSNVSSANANKIGLWYELDAIFAVVVGGTALTGGRYFIGGTLVGAIFIQMLTNTMYAQQVRPEIALIPKALVIVVVCLLQSTVFRRSVVSRLSSLKQFRSAIFKFNL